MLVADFRTVIEILIGISSSVPQKGRVALPFIFSRFQSFVWERLSVHVVLGMEHMNFMRAADELETPFPLRSRTAELEIHG